VGAGVSDFFDGPADAARKLADGIKAEAARKVRNRVIAIAAVVYLLYKERR
jgi:two-component sensor histidine kinase